MSDDRVRQIVLDAFMAGAAFGEGWMTLPEDETADAATDYVNLVMRSLGGALRMRKR